MVSSHDVKCEVYALIRKPIQKGSITTCINGCGLGQKERKVQDLEAVLAVDPHPHAGSDFQFGKMGEPIRVIGVREIDSTEELSVWRHGFVDHPVHYHICTSAHASGLIPLEAYKRMMENIKTADDVLELKNIINKYLNVCC